MQHTKLFPLLRFALCCVGLSVLAGCSPPAVPKLEPMRAQTPARTTYTDALNDLNTILEVYLPPDYSDIYFAIKPVIDDTGLSGQGEIPPDITSMVRDAISQVHYKVRHLESYDEHDISNMNAQLMMLQLNRLEGLPVRLAQRPAVDFTILGRISKYDRNVESTSRNIEGQVGFGPGDYEGFESEISASMGSSTSLSDLAVSFSVFDPSGISLPGRFGASMEVRMAQNSKDVGFSIRGNGIGYNAQAKAVQGRHQAIQMMTDFSMVQIIGRALNVPYWRVGASERIFTPDNLVVNEWRKEK